MKIEHVKIKIRDLVDGYKENEETNQVVGFHGKLDIRPPYQRENVQSQNKNSSTKWRIDFVLR